MVDRHIFVLVKSANSGGAIVELSGPLTAGKFTYFRRSILNANPSTASTTRDDLLKVEVKVTAQNLTLRQPCFGHKTLLPNAHRIVMRRTVKLIHFLDTPMQHLADRSTGPQRPL